MVLVVPPAGLVNPAKAIHEALKARGIPHKRTQAAILGVREDSWGKYVNGRKDAQATTVAAWIRHAGEVHELAIVLVWTFEGIEAAVEGPVRPASQ